MTSDVAKASPVGIELIRSQYEVRSKHTYLAVFLLEERRKGRNSKFWPYIETLPANYSTVPIFFDQDQLDQLKGSFSLAKIDDRIDQLKKEYNGVCDSLTKLNFGGNHTYDDFVWARLVVITRIFGISVNGVKTDGLVPMADMLNHKRPGQHGDTDTKWTYDDKQGGFIITATRSIQRGEEVFVCLLFFVLSRSLSHVYHFN